MKLGRHNFIKLSLGTILVTSISTTINIYAATMNVSVKVNDKCDLTTTAVNFPDYDPSGANSTTPDTGTGTITVTCTKKAAPKISIDLGANASGTTRRMISGGDYISYELYQPPTTQPGTACSNTPGTVWGTTGAQLFLTGPAPSKGSRTYNVCGQIPAGQDVPSGNYNDTVTVSFTF